MEFSISINSKFIAGLIFIAAVATVSYGLTKSFNKER